MFYLVGTHHEFGNVIYAECVNVNKRKPGDDFVYSVLRPTTCALFAEAFDMTRVETMRQLMTRMYPEYKWIPIGADSSQLIPDNMREVLGI